MWHQQGYYFPGWPGQQYANTVTPSPQQQSNPSDWAAKAQQWAQQRQVANQYYQQQQPQGQQQQQVAQWPHQQQHPYYTQQQQQPPVQQQHQHQAASIHQQPHIQQQAYGAVGTVQQQSQLQQQQQADLLQQHQQQASVYHQHQQGGAAPSSSLAAQHQQSHSLLSQPIGGEGGVAGGQGQLLMPAQAEHPTSASGSNPPAAAQPEPLFPQHNTPSQASTLPGHAYQPRPPPQSQQQYGSPTVQQKLSLLGDSPHASTNVSSSPQSSGTTPEGLLGRSPGMPLKPRALLEPPQPSVRPKSPANVPMSLESGRYGLMRGNVRPRFQERGVEISGPPRPRPPIDTSQRQANFNVWEQGSPQVGREIPTGPRPPTEEMFGEQKREEQLDYHQRQQPGEQQQQQHLEEHPVSIKREGGYQWQNTEEDRHSELTRDFQRRAQEEEWEVYGNGQNRASDHLEGDKDIRGPSPYRQHQFPYNEHSDRSNTMTSSPTVSISSLKSDEPTISSLRKEAVTTIPGLGGGFEEQENDVPKPMVPSSTTAHQTSEGAQQQATREGEGGGGAGGGAGTGLAGGTQANQMIKSLGKIVSQLQTLKGLTSSLQLLQTLPKGGEEGKRAEPVKSKESTEAELSEETKRKVAALLATESDSDGEQGADDVHRGPESRPRRDDYPPPSHEMAAREFDGTFDVKPQVYGTYGNENDYPPPQHARDGQRDYPPVDYRDHPDHRASARYQPPPPRMEREGYRPPPRDYYPPREEGYRRDYPPAREPPPPREPPLSERGYDYRQPPPRAPYDQRERDYERGPPPPRSTERMYEPPPHERDYPPPSHYRGRSSPPPPVGGGYEHQAREREGADPYYDAPRGRETGVAVEANLDRREHPADNEATDKIGIASKLQTIDYSHGSAYSNVKTVDYNHRVTSGGPSHPPAYQDPAYPSSSFDLSGYGGAGREAGYPYEGYQFPPGGGGYPPAVAAAAAGAFLPHGLDAATLFAAYASQAGESKRKALPSWLREELEKMERKRRKEMEKEALQKARLEGEKGQRAAWRDELDSGEEEEEHSRRREGREDREREKEREWEKGRGHSDRESRHRNIRPHYTSKSRSRSPNRGVSESPPPAKRHREEPEEDEEDRQVAMVHIMKIRKTLTEVLLEVTNREVLDIALETLDEERNPKMKFTMKSVPRTVSSEKNVLAGLSMYDSDISDSEHEADASKTQQPVLDPQVVAQVFKDIKPSSNSSKGNSGSSSKEKESKQGSSSCDKSGSSTSKHSSSSGSSSSKKEKSSSSKSDKSSSSSSKSSKKSSSSSSKKDTDERRSSSSSKHSKSESKGSSSSKSSSSKSSSSDKDSKSKHSSSSGGSSKSHSNRSPSPHRRSSSSSKQKQKEKDTESSSKSSSSKSSHKSESKSGRRSRSPHSSSSSGRKHSRHQRSRSRSRSQSPGHGTGTGGGGSKRTSSSSRKSPQRSTLGSYRHVQIKD